MPYQWNDDPTETLALSNGNRIVVKPIDLMGLVMSAENEAIPNGLLDQISMQMSGQAPDQEVICHSGTRLPGRGEPVEQGSVRGKVIDVSGTEERFTVRVSIPSGLLLQTGTVRFGGNCMATVESARQWVWRIGGGDAEQARKELPQLGAFINMICRAASVMPALVNEVTDPETQLDIKRVKQADKMVIFNWAMPREVRPAGMFPQEPPAGVAAASDLQGIPPESRNGVRPDASLGEIPV